MVSMTKGVTAVIKLEEFKRIELRVGEVLTAEPVPGTDRLLKLAVDLGGRGGPWWRSSRRVMRRTSCGE